MLHRNLLDIYQRFGETCCVLLQNTIQATRSFETVANLSDYTASCTGRLIFIATLPYFPFCYLTPSPEVTVCLLLCCIIFMTVPSPLSGRTQVSALARPLGLMNLSDETPSGCAAVSVAKQWFYSPLAATPPCGWATAVTHSIMGALTPATAMPIVKLRLLALLESAGIQVDKCL